MRTTTPALEVAKVTTAAWHSLPGDEVLAILDVGLEAGLSSPDASKRLGTHGPNRLPEKPGRSRLLLFLDQFTNLLVGILIAAAVLAAALGELADAAAILGIVIVNAVIGYVQERRAADALAALRRMTAPTARVRRDGRVQVVAAADLVPGDIVLLEAGDQVPADLRLLKTASLRTVEAALTGESEPVTKRADAAIAGPAALADRTTMAYTGTIVAAGLGEAAVVATGRGTELGRIAGLVESSAEDETPLQVRLRVFGKWLVIGSGAVVSLVFLMGLARGLPFVEMLMTAVSLAVAAVPEGLPAVVTIALALGVARMARKRSLVRKLASVETLGCTTVICSDKTGTLTVGQMTVRVVRTLDDEIAVEGEGYRPLGKLSRPLNAGEPIHETLRAAALCTTAKLIERNGATEVAGDPTEGALVVAALKAGIDPDRDEPVVSSEPFDSDRKRMSMTRRTAAGLRSYVKGAPEAILPQCVSVRDTAGDRVLAASERERLARLNDEMAGNGLRVLAVARRDMIDGGDPEAELVFLGFIGMQDPPRAEVKQAVAACRDAGIRPVMITGDNPRTALSIARALGIANDEGEVLTGPVVESLSDRELQDRVETIAVYARVSPEHKLRIVNAWKARGAVVAMTGDGVNDAPALKGADIGVAMGKSGTDVAKDASAMVIMDDNFATIVSAVEEGRAIFENIRKTLLYLLSGNAAEILVMAVAVVAGLPLPLLPIQLLWINLVTDGLPALALATDPADRDLLRRPPRRPGSEIADREFLLWMSVSAVLAAAVTLAAFLWGLYGEGSLDRARTYAFSTLVVEEVLRAFAFRSRTRVLWEIGLWSNARLTIIAIVTIGLQVFSHHSGALEAFLKTGEVDWWRCLAVTALAAVPVTVLEVWKLARRWWTPSPGEVAAHG